MMMFFLTVLLPQIVPEINGTASGGIAGLGTAGIVGWYLMSTHRSERKEWAATQLLRDQEHAKVIKDRDDKFELLVRDTKIFTAASVQESKDFSAITLKESKEFQTATLKKYEDLAREVAAETRALVREVQTENRRRDDNWVIMNKDMVHALEHVSTSMEWLGDRVRDVEVKVGITDIKKKPTKES